MNTVNPWLVQQRAKAYASSPDSWAREVFNRMEEAPSPQEERATDEQRLYMNALQLGLPKEVRQRWYWTVEEVADPKMTYREAEKAIAYLKREAAKGYRVGIYPPSHLYTDPKPDRSEQWFY